MQRVKICVIRVPGISNRCYWGALLRGDGATEFALGPFSSSDLAEERARDAAQVLGYKALQHACARTLPAGTSTDIAMARLEAPA